MVRKPNARPVVNPYLLAQQKNRGIPRAKNGTNNQSVEQLIQETKDRANDQREFATIDRNERQILQQFANLTKQMNEHSSTFATVKKLKRSLDAQMACNAKMVDKMKAMEHQLKNAQEKLRQKTNELNRIRAFIQNGASPNTRKLNV